MQASFFFFFFLVEGKGTFQRGRKTRYIGIVKGCFYAELLKEIGALYLQVMSIHVAQLMACAGSRFSIDGLMEESFD